MTINIKIPTSWNELDNWQLKQIAKYSHSNMSGVLFDYKIFLVLLNVRWCQIYKRWKALKVFQNIPLQTLKEQYSWLYSDLNLTKFIPSIKIKNKKLFAPADRLTNITVDEFAHADDLFLGWYNSQDFEYLQFLTAVLYRENNNKGKRITFDKTELESKAKLIKIDKKTLLTIALSYQGSRNYLIAQFPLVFPKPKKNTKAPLNSGFGKLILHLSGGKFGTYNETKNTNIYTFLAEFEEQLKNKPYA